MRENLNAARAAGELYSYKAAKAELDKAAKEAGMLVNVYQADYPMTMRIFSETEQLNMYDEIDDDGEVGYVELTMLEKTYVKSTLKRPLPADTLKKLIRKAEAVNGCYLRAFRAVTGGATETMVNEEIVKQTAD